MVECIVHRLFLARLKGLDALRREKKEALEALKKANAAGHYDDAITVYSSLSAVSKVPPSIARVQNGRSPSLYVLCGSAVR